MCTYSYSVNPLPHGPGFVVNIKVLRTVSERKRGGKGGRDGGGGVSERKSKMPRSSFKVIVANLC